ncbi:uncharacterized protein LOC143253020 [Tachypleus tridentatus]|uniref:uncharacterized protein LOC143253020 n=1 Tax=Tachypleus tridentatus TaxID=6853 RepID=UPI003FD2127D
MNLAWKKLWPDSVADRDFEGFEAEPVVEDIVSLGKCMGMNVSGDDVEELVEDHNTELIAEELQDLQKEQQQKATEEVSSDEEEEKFTNQGNVWKIGRVSKVCGNFHPDKSVANGSKSFQ